MKRLVTEIICYGIAFLFVYAAVSKLSDYEKFLIQLGQSPMLTLIAPFVAWFIPFAELVIALLLLWPSGRGIGLPAAFALMTLFTAYIIVITQFSAQVPCSCGGVLEKMGWTAHLIFNGVFMLLSLTGILLHHGLSTDADQRTKATIMTDT